MTGAELTRDQKIVRLTHLLMLSANDAGVALTLDDVAEAEVMAAQIIDGNPPYIQDLYPTDRDRYGRLVWTTGGRWWNL